jgi:hypothetical protein
MNLRLPVIFIVIMLTFCDDMVAQQSITGKIYTASDSVIVGATVFNASKKLSVVSAADGRYSITAAEGEKLIFTAVGYIPDTVVVAFHMLLTPQDITLQIDPFALAEVRVTASDYSTDSLRRRDYYRHILDQKDAGITGRNTPTGFGVNISPISYFSRAARQKRQLRKRLIRFEREDYIDQSFPVPWVERLTNLHGDSLRLFYTRYRPSYSFCRETDRMGMIIYINDKLKEFRKPKT